MWADLHLNVEDHAHGVEVGLLAAAALSLESAGILRFALVLVLVVLGVVLVLVLILFRVVLVLVLVLSPGSFTASVLSEAASDSSSSTASLRLRMRATGWRTSSRDGRRTVWEAVPCCTTSIHAL